MKNLELQRVYMEYKSIAERYQLLTENTVECIWLFDLTEMKYKYVSPSVLELRGITVEDAINEDLRDSFTPESLEHLKTLAETISPLLFNESGEQESLGSVNEYQQYTKDGGIINVEISTKFLADKESGKIEIIGVTRDISERKRMEAELKKEVEKKNELIEKLSNMAVKDKLTGVFNRYYLDQRVQEEIALADRYEIPIALAILDLDHFKKVNDKYGHNVGDEVLKKVANTVSRMTRKSDVFARWGGEEFAMLMPHTTANGAFVMAEKIRVVLEGLDHEVAGRVTASIGVAEKMKLESYESWFKRTDHALYRAKGAGRNFVVVTDNKEMTPLAHIHLEWISSWECGNRIIDDQHKQLLYYGNTLMDAAFSNADRIFVIEKLDQLLDHVVFHFQDEIRILRKTEFQEIEEHSAIHRELINAALAIKKRYLEGTLKSTEFLSFLLDDVILGHMLKEDVKFFEYV